MENSNRISRNVWLCDEEDKGTNVQGLNTFWTCHSFETLGSDPFSCDSLFTRPSFLHIDTLTAVPTRCICRLFLHVAAFVPWLTSPETGTESDTVLTGPAAVLSKCHNAATMSSYGGSAPPLPPSVVLQCNEICLAWCMAAGEAQIENWITLT